MTNKIFATFVRKRMQDSGSDNTMDYYVYEFENIIDEENKILIDAWIKETKLLQAVPFKKGKRYEIYLSDKPNLQYCNRLSYPVEIIWDEGKVSRKNGNRIVSQDSKGNERIHSFPPFYIPRK